jgi:protein-S-isoprenylcysteine O-methyltransferase Ste14
MMTESFTVTLFPVLFLIVLFGGGELFRRQAIDMDGDPPINRPLFYISKYSIVILWAAMALQSWGIGLSLTRVPVTSKWAALCLWVFGFLLLFSGRFGLGRSFRIGSPKEKTQLHVDGLFTFSRNPMYLGVYATIVASVLYTWNPVALLIGIFVVVVHHLIVLAEERYLQEQFGEEYTEYCRRVRRYL